MDLWVPTLRFRLDWNLYEYDDNGEGRVRLHRNGVPIEPAFDASTWDPDYRDRYRSVTIGRDEDGPFVCYSGRTDPDFQWLSTSPNSSLPSSSLWLDEGC